MKRRTELDVLRVACMCAVVFLHAAAGPLQDLSHPVFWRGVSFLVTLATPAVPLFFMLSGALMLSGERELTVSDVLRRRVPKLLIPLLAWSVIFFFYNRDVAGVDSATHSLLSILGTPANVAYWFLYALIPIYLIAPLLKVMTGRLSEAQWRYLIVLWALFPLGLSTLRSLLPQELQYILTEHLSLNLNLVGGYLGYFLLGRWLDRLERLPSVKVLVGGEVLLVLGICADTWHQSFARGEYASRFNAYLGLVTALQAAGLFLLAKALFGGREGRGRALPFLAELSFGVYLAHPMVIFQLAEPWHRWTGEWVITDVLPLVIYYLAVLGISLLLSAALGAVPGLRYLFTGRSGPALFQKGRNDS